jgi:hypothetical protein
MDTLKIFRLETSPSGTIGVLTLNTQVVGLTMEPPKKSNKKGISCVPTGQYFCKHYQSEKFKRTCIALHNVYGRNYISIHPGNVVGDTKGCVLPGGRVGTLNGRRAVLDSNKMLDKIIGNTSRVFILTIVENFG